MPNNNIFSNTEALRRGNERAQWKQRMTLEYFRNANYRKDAGFGFDFRDMYAIIPLFIDISSVVDRPEEEKKEYFISELKKIEDAFVNSKVPGMPDPERVKPYIKKLYDTIATHSNIDWDDEAAIDNIFCSMVASQAIGTMVEKFTAEIIELYPDQNASMGLDVISTKSYLNYRKLQAILVDLDPDLLRNVGIGASSLESHSSDIEMHINTALVEATEKGKDSVTLDPTGFELAKKFFLEDSFTIKDKNGSDPDYVGNYTADNAAYHYFCIFSSVYGKTAIEYMTVDSAVNNQADKGDELLFINGKCLHDLVNEKVVNEKVSEYQAKVAVGKMLRDAMTDGHGIVSIMRPSITAEGKAAFKHQEIKVDLDKLNRIDRNENHNAFRRMLDYFGIWKIAPKFASNDARDAAQAEVKSSHEYRNAVRAAEDRFVASYNEAAAKGKDNKLYKRFPTITKEAQVNENEREMGVNNAEMENERVRLEVILEENENDIEIEPMKDGNEKALERGNPEP